MKKILIVIFVFLSSLAMAQVEKGDKNLTFNFSYTNFDGNGFGILAGKFGYFITQHIEAGITPQILFGSAFSAYGTGIYGTYNFLTGSGKLLPYAGAAFSFLAGDIETTAIGVYGGTKYFIKENVNIDAGINASANLGAVGGTVVTFQIGVGFLLGRRN